MKKPEFLSYGSTEQGNRWAGRLALPAALIIVFSAAYKVGEEHNQSKHPTTQESPHLTPIEFNLTIDSANWQIYHGYGYKFIANYEVLDNDKASEIEFFNHLFNLKDSGHYSDIVLGVAFDKKDRMPERTLDEEFARKGHLKEIAVYGLERPDEGIPTSHLV